MAASTSGDDNPLLAQLVTLTEAIKQLAEHPTPRPVSFDASADADRIRQRVAFGYQVLGTLMGRVSSPNGTEFDVPVVQARRRGEDIEFAGLPPGADWVELRTGTTVEVLRIRNADGRSDPEDDRSPAATEAPRPQPDGKVTPQVFTKTVPIGSTVFLRTRRGPLIAFGPRLGPLRSDSADLQRT